MFSLNNNYILEYENFDERVDKFYDDLEQKREIEEQWEMIQEELDKVIL